MSLSTQEQILIEQRVTNEAKSAGVAYLLWFFLGALGAHRFYLARTGTAIAQLLFFIFGWMTIVIGIGALLLIPLAIWVLVDAFLIPGMIQRHKAEVRKRLGMDIMLAAGAQTPMIDTSRWSRKDRERLAAQAAREPRG
ncbi:MAG: TM2 domain-containing protein [Mesorhizobium sp.]|uniref:TM2 domain-containing protein n=1 Tax=Mesorhizobium sp. TaxID=1871066 RepID=UPI000FE60331|nr:TM2 domain-containing protein [Mesorhizobium sp.]RWL87733.1 MAG: TM2 domain-containing protein [Mesorhizobium sp.]